MVAQTGEGFQLFVVGEDAGPAIPFFQNNDAQLVQPGAAGRAVDDDAGAEEAGIVTQAVSLRCVGLLWAQADSLRTTGSLSRRRGGHQEQAGADQQRKQVVDEETGAHGKPPRGILLMVCEVDEQGQTRGSGPRVEVRPSR